MKRLKALLTFIPMMLGLVIGVYLPIVALGYGLLILLIDKPEVIFNLVLIYAGFFAVIACIGVLARHPKTKAVTQTILWCLAVAFFVHSCNTYKGSGGGCTPSRYIDCDY